MSLCLAQPARPASIDVLNDRQTDERPRPGCGRKRGTSSRLMSMSLRLRGLIARPERCGAYLSVETETQFGLATSRPEQSAKTTSRPWPWHRHERTRSIQSRGEAGARLRPKACVAVTEEASLRHRPMRGKRRDRASAAFRSWLRRERLSIVVRPRPRQSWHPLAQHHRPTMIFGGPLPRCWMLPSRLFRSTALLFMNALDGAAGSRGIESIHGVDRSASRLLYAMLP